MVTPYSQFVGSQCAINVILGKRYEQVTDEVIQYAMGAWGEEECSSTDPDVRDRILDRPRAKELAGWQPPDTSVEELREKIGGPGVSVRRAAAALLYLRGRRCAPCSKPPPGPGTERAISWG